MTQTQEQASLRARLYVTKGGDGSLTSRTHKEAGYEEISNTGEHRRGKAWRKQTQTLVILAESSMRCEQRGRQDISSWRSD